jgi:cupin superfamily acireductone dioxygenase involved in methionine salvage
MVENKKYILFKSILTDVPKWEDFIENLDYNYSKTKNKEIKINDSRFITSNIQIYNKLDPIIFHCFNYKTKNLFLKYFKIKDTIKNILGNEPTAIKSIINFVGGEQNYWIHSDDHDVVSWHCIGNIKWEFFNSESDVEPYSTVILEPGDILYVPKGIYHRVTADGPRASLLFAYHDNLVN